MLLQIYLKGGNAVDMEVQSYNVKLRPETGEVEDLSLFMYDDSRAKLTYINPSEIIAIVTVDPVEHHPEVRVNGGS